MYCELKNKEVEITVVGKVTYGSDNKVIPFKDCSGNYANMFGKKVGVKCDMSDNKKCLLNR